MSTSRDTPRIPTLPGADLHVCPTCSRPFVAPRAILMLADREHFVVELACENCEWWAVRILDEEQIEALDRALDEATTQIAEAVSDLHAAEELERIDAFVGALREDLILPEDF
jgi:hypothetical protein